MHIWLSLLVTLIGSGCDFSGNMCETTTEDNSAFPNAGEKRLTY
jgi:hypothetical protein